MLKEILREWLSANSDCLIDSENPDVLIFERDAALDVNALAAFLLENPTTD